MSIIYKCQGKFYFIRAQKGVFIALSMTAALKGILAIAALSINITIRN